MKRKNEGHRYTDDIAREYELITLAYPDFEAFQRRMVEGVDFAAGAEREEPFHLLEIGTGDGFATVKLLRAMKAAGNRGTFTSVDINHEMIEKARALLKTVEPEHSVHLRESDALAYLQDEPEGTFDVVATSFTLHNFERTYREEVEKQIHRVLRTGGLYTNADKYAPEGQEQFDALARHVDQFFEAFVPRGKTELLRKWVIHNISDQSPRHVMFADETVARLQALGFRKVALTERAGLQAVLRAYKG
ncbi:MAG: class I SAM-dependent methyltransferase [Spirochaetaceae bacterium]|nr:MAG: class I SAM-dependent methyltransferase [Spirochaetaceae bacterium]